MTARSFEEMATESLSIKNVPRRIILPSQISQAMQGAMLGSLATMREQGGAIFAQRSNTLYVRSTFDSAVTATKLNMNVDRQPLHTTDRILATFHTHPRSADEPEFELSDPPSGTDMDTFVQLGDRMVLIRTRTLTYGLLKTAEFDTWMSTLFKLGSTKGYYRKELSSDFSDFKHEAMNRGFSKPRAYAIAAMRVAKKYHLAFYVGGPTTIRRIDDLVR
jgi:hypothetical protein